MKNFKFFRKSLDELDIESYCKSFVTGLIYSGEWVTTVFPKEYPQKNFKIRVNYITERTNFFDGNHSYHSNLTVVPYIMGEMKFFNFTHTQSGIFNT